MSKKKSESGQLAFQSQVVVSEARVETCLKLNQQWNSVLFVTTGQVNVECGKEWVYLFPNRILLVKNQAETRLSFVEGARLIYISVHPEFYPLNEKLGCYQLTGLSREVLLYLNREKEKVFFGHKFCDLLKIALDDCQDKDKFYLSIPLPEDPRAYHILEALKKSSFTYDLDELTKIAGASKRTIERIFRSEIGMTFSKWRQLVRLQQSLILLDQGLSPDDVAIEVGYKNSNSFVHSFKEIFNSTPRQYLKKCKKNSQWESG